MSACSENESGHGKLKSEVFFKYFVEAEKSVFAYILVMVHSRVAAEDLFQETASLMWEQFDDFQRDKSFTVWGMTIARYKILEYFKKESYRKHLFKEDVYAKIEAAAAVLKEDQTDRIEAVRSCLKKLNASDQKLISLRYEDNLKVVEIAELVNRSKDGLYKTLSRIHGLLQECVTRTLARLEQQ